MKGMKARRKKGSSILTGLISLILVCVALVAGFVIYQITQAPDISEIDATPNGYMTTILDKDGNIMDSLYVTESNRIYVKLENIPEHLQKAFIAIEDARFYDHHGIDLKGIARAGVKGVTSGFHFSQGASTITQQLLKNNVFTDWMAEENFYDSLCRKIQEWYLAVQLEGEYSKEWILENYLNTINLGGGTRGVQVAAQYYYGKDVSELTLAESALIAGITKNPTAYNPMNNPEKSVERQHLVLQAMLDQGYISEEQYDEAMLENVISKLVTDSGERVQVFSWFEDALLEQIITDLTTKYTYTESEAWDLVYSGGLTIYSTQDTQLQTICEKVATSSEWYTGNEQISVVMTDVSSGGVAAIIGGREEKTSSLIYNRATSSIRQPGSTIKILGEYAAGIDLKILSLGTVIADNAHTYSDGTSISNSYSSYKGMTTVRDAIAVSSNVVALKSFQQVGMEKVYEYLQKFGITTLTGADKNEALAIGGTHNGVTNLEMTAAYNAIANQGSYVQPFYYTKVVDRNGKTILERGTEKEQVISKEAAKLLTCAMEDVVTSGTGIDAAVEGITLAGKSGTTNENKDLWFIGFSGYYTCGIWGGFDDNSAQTNGGYVKRIWHAIMEQAHKEKEDVALVDTSDLVCVTICKKCGNLAVDGLCDDTVQGNMAVKEYYIDGTQPTRNCDCHVSVTICQDSGMTPGKYCPSSARVTKVYLKNALAGTEDAGYGVPEMTEETCNIHTDFWDQWKKSESQDGDAQSDGSSDEDTSDQGASGEDNSENQNGSEGNWMKDWFDGLFGNS